MEAGPAGSQAVPPKRQRALAELPLINLSADVR
jgi:hypothetical protein